MVEPEPGLTFHYSDSVYVLAGNDKPTELVEPIAQGLSDIKLADIEEPSSSLCECDCCDNCSATPNEQIKDP